MKWVVKKLTATMNLGFLGAMLWFASSQNGFYLMWKS